MKKTKKVHIRKKELMKENKVFSPETPPIQMGPKPLFSPWKQKKNKEKNLFVSFTTYLKGNFVSLFYFSILCEVYNAAKFLSVIME